MLASRIGFVAGMLFALMTSVETQAAPAKTVGVVSLLPSAGRLYHVALLRFSNECKPFDLRNAGLENAVYNAATSVLSPRYKLVRMSAPVGAAIHTSNTEVMGAFKSFPSIAEQLRQMVRPQIPVDLYVLVWAQQAHSDCNDHPMASGFGMTKQSLNSSALVHGYAQLIVTDAHTNEDLSTVWPRAEAPLPAFAWKDDKPAQVSDQQMQIIKAELQRVLSAAVTSELRRVLPAQ